jgi:hypothetical protein
MKNEYLKFRSEALDLVTCIYEEFGEPYTFNFEDARKVSIIIIDRGMNFCTDLETYKEQLEIKTALEKLTLK